MSLFTKHSLKVLNKEFAEYVAGRQSYEQIAAKLDLPVARPLKKDTQLSVSFPFNFKKWCSAIKYR